LSVVMAAGATTIAARGLNTRFKNAPEHRRGRRKLGALVARWRRLGREQLCWTDARVERFGFD
jgi:hypothetical protein